AGGAGRGLLRRRPARARRGGRSRRRKPGRARRRASATLEPQSLAERPRLASGHIELGALLVVQREPEPVRACPANGRDLGEVDHVAAVDPRKAAARKQLLELSERRRREVATVIAMYAAVVAVGLDPVNV